MKGGWRLLAWTAALVLALRGLHALGGGSLGVPLGSVDDLSAWIARAPAEVMTLALVRLAALAAAWYLAACTLVLAAVRGLGRPHLVANVSRMAPAVVCRAVSGGGGIAVAIGAVLGGLPSTAPATLPRPSPAAAGPAGAVHAPGAPAPTATMTRLTDDPPTATMTRLTDDPPTATMTRLTDDPPTATMARRPAGATAPAGAPASPPSGPERPPMMSENPASTSTWIVEAGDSFWSIAVDTVSGSTGGEHDARRVVGYWRQLIEANRSRLLDPANPDLLVPGQELVVPYPAR